jgi:hypothetical protein
LAVFQSLSIFENSAKLSTLPAVSAASLINSHTLQALAIAHHIAQADRIHLHISQAHLSSKILQAISPTTSALAYRLSANDLFGCNSNLCKDDGLTQAASTRNSVVSHKYLAEASDNLLIVSEYRFCHLPSESNVAFFTVLSI